MSTNTQEHHRYAVSVDGIDWHQYVLGSSLAANILWTLAVIVLMTLVLYFGAKRFLLGILKTYFTNGGGERIREIVDAANGKQVEHIIDRTQEQIDGRWSR